MLNPKSQWQDALRSAHYVPVAYSPAEISYQNAYHGRPDATRLVDSAIFPHGYVPLNASKRAANAILDDLGAFELREPWTGSVSRFQQEAVRRGATVGVEHFFYFDLGLEPLEAFDSKTRKCVRDGLSFWEIRTETDRAAWDQFRELHLKVAGRVTRPAESWECQWKAIQSGDAFLVTLWDGRMVGGGYFAVTRDEGCYNVAAYDRDLFPKPLGHVVQYTAINEMRKRGLKWYRVGQKVYQGTPKELSISEFKSGFATHVLPQHIIRKSA